MEMVLDCDVAAMKIVDGTIGRKAVKTLQKRAKPLAAFGEEPKQAT